MLDVTTYSLDPRLLPFTFQLERRTVLKAKDFVPDGDWNRYVYVLHLRPLPVLSPEQTMSIFLLHKVYYNFFFIIKTMLNLKLIFF